MGFVRLLQHCKNTLVSFSHPVYVLRGYLVSDRSDVDNDFSIIIFIKKVPFMPILPVFRFKNKRKNGNKTSFIKMRSGFCEALTAL